MNSFGWRCILAGSLMVLGHGECVFSKTVPPPSEWDWETLPQCPEFRAQYTIQIKSAEPEKSRVSIEAMLRKHGGKARAGYGGNMAVYALPHKIAKKASLETVRYGTLVQYQLYEQIMPGMVEKLDEKIKPLAAEMDRHQTRIDEMPVIKDVLSTLLAKLRKRRSGCAEALERVQFQVTVVAGESQETQ